MNTTWFYIRLIKKNSNAWSNVYYLMQWLNKKGIASVILKAGDNIRNAIRNPRGILRAGLVAFFSNDGGKTYTHAVYISKVSNDTVYYSGHTNSYYDRVLPNTKGYSDFTVKFYYIV